MPKSREVVVSNGKPAFYACIFDDLKKAALSCGWALGLHGSLASDMDIMAMPWTEDAKPVEEMIQALSDCFTDSPFKEHHTIPHYGKPNNRVVYTISIWGDFYLDINVINPNAVIPLDIDQEVYIIQDGEVLGFRVYEYQLLSINQKNIRYWAECFTDSCEDNMDFWSDDIGKSVFLDKKHAEAALKEADKE